MIQARKTSDLEALKNSEDPETRVAYRLFKGEDAIGQGLSFEGRRALINCFRDIRKGEMSSEACRVFCQKHNLNKAQFTASLRKIMIEEYRLV